MAIDEAREGIRKQHGGPFGSVIVKDREAVEIFSEVWAWLLCMDEHHIYASLEQLCNNHQERLLGVADLHMKVLNISGFDAERFLAL